jgi:uncharacterized protein YxjI
MTTTAPWDLPHYRIRRKLLKIFGASFHVYDGDRIVAFCKQKAFKLKEDIRLFADESLGTELLWIRARQVIDFAASYDVVDSASQQKVGALRRRGFKSMLRDSWEVLDVQDKVIGKVEEDSMAMAMLRRLLSNLIPQKFHLTGGGGRAAVLKQRFNPFIFSLEVDVPQDLDIDKRLVFGAAVLLSAIEGRQG